MPVVKVEGTPLNYYFIAFDKDGNERPNPDSNEPTSQEILNILSKEKNTDITDIFLRLNHLFRELAK
ncbi:MAG: hypothetical protein F6K30_19475 [Cyanothece sp. SIO2G6]|nr:hypothetical protein [Cyanothece sp. SIO2G6]